MSRNSALTPEEWRQRGFARTTWTMLPRPEHWDGQMSPSLYLTEDGTLCAPGGLDTSDDGDPLDATKVMALANLSLTLQQKPGAITGEHVNVCLSAAWYFRKLARELIATASKMEVAEERAAFLDHARSLTAGNETLFQLSEMLGALVPPE